MGGEDGDPLPYVPEWSFGAERGLRVDGEGQHARVCRRQPGLHGRPYRPSSTTGLPTAASARLDGYTTLNLRAGAYLGRWSVELYGKNLTNERGVTSIEPGPLPNGAIGLGLVRPRTVGLSVATRFWGS